MSQSSIIVGNRVFWVEFNSLGIVSQGFLIFVNDVVDESSVVVGICTSWVNLYRFCLVSDSLLVVF